MQSTNTSCGYVAFLGAPNAGKSTLLNFLVGQKLAIVTPKAQTTRSRISGVLIEGGAQLVLLDVPGVFDAPATKPFEQAMVAAAWSAVSEADVVAVIVDARRGLDVENKDIIAKLNKGQKHHVLILNKIDLVAKESLLALIAEANGLFAFDDTFLISALKGDGIDRMKAHLANHVPSGPWLFPEDHLTDLPQRLIASEITREKCFLKLREELPYSLTVETEAWEEKRDGSIKISQSIVVERESQKGIILGKGGAMLKMIGQSSRIEIEEIWECKVHLFLFVKVRENWKQQRDTYSYLGLNFKG